MVIQLMNHLAIGHDSTIWLPARPLTKCLIHVGNQISTVQSGLICAKRMGTSPSRIRHLVRLTGISKHYQKV